MFVFGACLVAALVWVPLPARLSEGDSVVVAWRDGTPAHVFLSPDDKWRIRVETDDVSPAYIDALLAFEDQRFWSHPGVDLIAIARAFLSNLSAGRTVSGASTLTMQVVRLLEPRPRTLASKVIEAFRAVQLEMHLSKRQILEEYLRLAPFGRNVEGVEAASWAYFRHRARDLTADEIAVLLAVPQSPTARFPSANNRARLRAARDSIARRLLDEGLLPRGTGEGAVGPEALLDDIVASPVPESLEAFPREIPHAAYWLRHRHPSKAFIQTTLDAATQRVVEQQVARRFEEAQRVGVHNVSVVVVDHATVEARALVGNFTFDLQPGAQIPGFDVPRSPGSLLKPFVTAAAIDGRPCAAAVFGA
ncbi:MAG: transglycosylase domain-containing protein [bacterium]